MGLFPRRRDYRPANKAVLEQSDINTSVVLRCLVESTTLAGAPGQIGQHFQRLGLSPLITQNIEKALNDHDDCPNSPSFTVSANIHQRLQHIFDDLVGRAPTFSNRRMSLSLPGVHRYSLHRERFARFLEEHQCEALFTPLSRDYYHFGDFLNVWLNDFSWNAARPPSPAEIGDLTHPISHYFINSSHNTYLVGDQFLSQASASIYEEVLESSCRCIEIDVWDPVKPKKSTAKLPKSPKTPKSPKSPKLPMSVHRRTFSSTSLANSIHDSIDAAANLFAARLSRSRASSFSQRSIASPPTTDEPRFEEVRPGWSALSAPALDEAVVLSESHTDASTLADAQDAVDDREESAEGLEDPKASQSTVASATAQINVTAPDTNEAVPAEVPDENDAWGDAEPVVMHAHKVIDRNVSLGGCVSFREVCKAVKRSAFTKNSMPVIVSLEVHTDSIQQRKMVQIMKEEWQDALLDAPVGRSDPRLRLPTLDELQGKILVKVKRAHAAPGPGHTGANGKALAHSTHASRLGSSLAVYQRTDEGDATGSDDDISATNVNSAGIANSQITKELGSLAVYTESRHFKGFTDGSAKLPSHIFSISDTDIKNYHTTHHESLFNHNKTYLMRSYPYPWSHFLSTNPDPAFCWRRGVQMVSLNWQSMDKGMMLNHAMFDGTPGWVLKPEGLRAGSAAPPSNSGPSTASSAPGKAHLPMGPCPVATAVPTCSFDLVITVFAGQNLPLPRALAGKINKKKRASLGATRDMLINRAFTNSFRPVVKCELNVEPADKRCPESVDKRSPEPGATPSSSFGLASKTTTTTTTPAGTPSVPSTLPGSTTTALAVGVPAAQTMTNSSKSTSEKDKDKERLEAPKHKTMPSKSDHPHWGTHGETLTFSNVTSVVEALSFIIFRVEDDASSIHDKLAAWACIRLDRLRTGYRFVRLMTAHGDASEGKLFVKIEKRYH